MAIYLDENQFGDDAGCIGFPHLLLCMGLVVMTDRNLYGAHLAVPGQESSAVVAALGNLIAANHAPADMKALYGCCDRKARYRGSPNKKSAWKAEMTLHAGRLGFHGPVYGFCTSIISPNDGTYVEYHPQYLQRRCKVFYKRNEKVDYTTGNPPANIQAYSPYRQTVVNPSVATTTASIKVTASNKGQLHEVNYFLRMSSFSV